MQLTREHEAWPRHGDELGMSGLDASFLHVESPTAHMHTLKVLVVELRPSTRGARRVLIDRLAQQIDRLPALALRARARAFARPVWQRVKPDLSAHVTYETVWGGASAVEEAVGAFASRRLRRDRPLWELLALHDRARRELTLVLKIHHALADGRAAERMLEIAAGAADLETVHAPPRRAGSGLVLRGLMVLLAAGELLVRTLAGWLRVRRLARELGARRVGPFGGARVSFAAPVSADRRIAFANLPLADVSTVRDAASATVNDVVLALSAGALRSYLTSRGEPVDAPLVASMPVGVGEARYTLGNALSNLLVPIHVEEADPWTRLKRASTSASHAKALHEARGPQLLMRWSELAPRFALKTLWALVRRSKRAPVDLVVSNVRGPRGPLSLGGAALKRLYSVGPLLETTGLNLTFWSYAGRLHAAVLACGEHGSDPRAIASELERELARLVTIASSDRRLAA